MALVSALILALALPAAAQESPAARAAVCHEWHECRQLALDALASGNFERFHDFAWRTVQTGPPKDPALMYLLARAQSLSGRPDDALVMLGRIADMGVASDAATNDDFRAVRALKGWPELEARLSALAASSAPTETPNGVVNSGAPDQRGPKASAPQARGPQRGAQAAAPQADRPAAQPEREARAEAAPPDIAAPAHATPQPSTPEPANPEPGAETSVGGTTPARSSARPDDLVRVADAALAPQGLAYDAVSSRFVVADPVARKLVILDQRTQHAVDLARATSAGFDEIAAFEIDPRRGDLWVLSSGDIVDGSPQPSLATLHKLQLVSGRQIASFAVPDRLAPARFDDIAVTPGGAVLMLDRQGGRIVAFEPGSHGFKVVATLHLPEPTSLAPADEHLVYVSYSGGVARVDIATGAVTPLHGDASKLSGFARLRWSDGTLVGVQQRAERSYAAVRLKVAGSRVAAAETIDADPAIADPTAVTLAGRDLYVLTRGGPDHDGEIVVERFRLK